MADVSAQMQTSFGQQHGRGHLEVASDPKRQSRAQLAIVGRAAWQLPREVLHPLALGGSGRNGLSPNALSGMFAAEKVSRGGVVKSALNASFNRGS